MNQVDMQGIEQTKFICKFLLNPLFENENFIKNQKASNTSSAFLKVSDIFSTFLKINEKQQLLNCTNYEKQQFLNYTNDILECYKNNICNMLKNVANKQIDKMDSAYKNQNNKYIYDFSEYKDRIQKSINDSIENIFKYKTPNCMYINLNKIQKNLDTINTITQMLNTDFVKEFNDINKHITKNTYTIAQCHADQFIASSSQALADSNSGICNVTHLEQLRKFNSLKDNNRAKKRTDVVNSSLDTLQNISQTCHGSVDKYCEIMSDLQLCKDFVEEQKEQIKLQKEQIEQIEQMNKVQSNLHNNKPSYVNMIEHSVNNTEVSNFVK